jgi:hypothetical protein
MLRKNSELPFMRCGKANGRIGKDESIAVEKFQRWVEKFQKGVMIR